jgi:hypothetical protein
MEIQGTLKAIQPIVERGGFKSRKIWITTAENPEYPQTIEIEVNQAKVELFAGVSIGAPVTCHVNLRGREWTGADGVTKVFNTIVCWEVMANSKAAVSTQAGTVAQTAHVTDGQQAPELSQDLPF